MLRISRYLRRWRWLAGCNCRRHDTRRGKEWALGVKTEVDYNVEGVSNLREHQSVNLECIIALLWLFICSLGILRSWVCALDWVLCHVFTDLIQVSGFVMYKGWPVDIPCNMAVLPRCWPESAHNTTIHPAHPKGPATYSSHMAMPLGLCEVRQSLQWPTETHVKDQSSQIIAIPSIVEAN